MTITIQAQVERLLRAATPLGDTLRLVYDARPWDDAAAAYWASLPREVRAAADLVARATDKGRHIIARHVVRPSAALLVVETVADALRTRPSMPALLRKPGYACVKRPERGERLGGNATELLWVPDIFGLSFEAEATVHDGDANHHRVHFGYRPCSTGGEAWLIGEHPWLAQCGISESEATIRFVALGAWLYTFAMLIEAEGAPIDALPEAEAPRGRRHAKSAGGRAWPGTRYVYLDRAGPRSTPHRDLEAQESGPGLEHLARELRRVRGHLRHQPCGPNRSQRKLIYVREFDRHVHVNPHKVTVVAARPGADRKVQ